MHNHCFRTHINVKFGPPSENSSSLMVSQAGYGSASDCCLVGYFQLCYSAQSFHNKIFQVNIKFS